MSIVDRYKRAAEWAQTCELKFWWDPRGMVDAGAYKPGDMYYIRGPEAMSLISHLRKEIERADAEADARVAYAVSLNAAPRRSEISVVPEKDRNNGTDTAELMKQIAALKAQVSELEGRIEELTQFYEGAIRANGIIIRGVVPNTEIDK